MTPEQFTRAGIRLYGLRWKAPMARALGRDPSMIWRYATDQVSIPELVAVVVRMLLREQRRKKLRE